jgi:hypothetical protein
MFMIAALMIASSEAGCWNYITGSRCDNEDFWANLGYKKCNDRCKELGKSGGSCVTNTESCLGLSRDANVCTCN